MFLKIQMLSVFRSPFLIIKIQTRFYFTTLLKDLQNLPEKLEKS